MSEKRLQLSEMATLGAEVSGVDLRKALDPALRVEIEQALLEHLVLFFTGQNLRFEDHRRFALAFGEIYTHPIGLPNVDPEHPEIFEFYSDSEQPHVAKRWHSDSSFEPDPPSISILRAIEVPPSGGDTLWASMSAAWEGLSDSMQRLLSGLEAVHAPNYFTEVATPEQRKRILERGDIVHPVVRTHPISGRKGLYVNATFTNQIVGMTKKESHALLSFLYDHIDSAEYHCRFHWTQNALAMWDNRITQHRVIADRPSARRRMQRLTLVGERPV